jgi:hypothetical protein
MVLELGWMTHIRPPMAASATQLCPREHTISRCELRFPVQSIGGRIWCILLTSDALACFHLQGDGNVPIHDWALEETLSAIVMQAEQCLQERDITSINSCVRPSLPLQLCALFD